jgi:hypothetical protein
MALSQPRSAFGIDSIAFYNRTSGEFYGAPLRVLAGSELNFTGEVIDLVGGSSKFPWGSSEGAITAEVNMTIREYPDYLFNLFLGATATTTALTTGSVSVGVNKKGTSIINGTNGISSVIATVGDTADLKTGKYVIKATGAAAADVYVSSTIDVAASLITNDLMKIFSIDVSSTSAVNAAFGLTFNKIGTPAFVTDDTAEFEVINASAASESVVTVGASGASFPEFGCLIYAQKQGSAEIFEIDLFKVKAVGMPIVLKEKAYSEYSITGKASYDATKDGVYRLRMIK